MARQVLFWIDGKYMPGILYNHKIICACCGEVYDTFAVLKQTPEGLQGILAFDDWADLCGNPIVSYEDYFQVLNDAYGEEKFKELSTKFDFFAKF